MTRGCGFLGGCGIGEVLLQGPFVLAELYARLDADVLAWFKREGRGYQTRINRALRGVMWEEERKSWK
jgi:hypothetical protein